MSSVCHAPRSSLSLLSLALALTAPMALVACGGGDGDKKVSAGPERGVVVQTFGASKDRRGNLYLRRDGIWQRPGMENSLPEAKGDQVDSELCDQPAPATGTVLTADLDSMCFVTGFDANGKQVGGPCLVSSGISRNRYALGAFNVLFVNNSTHNPQNVGIQGLGYNVRILNSNNETVWNLVEDQPDYLDWVREIENLKVADVSGTCATVSTISDARSLPGRAVFNLKGDYFSGTIEPAETLEMNIKWDGNDRNGIAVPAGEYTAVFEVSVVDTDTGGLWAAPAPVKFTIADAPVAQ
ncbi:Hypothetical protein HDN1F_30340 [gamma proteobacterium HdN1]|nr:Hypothetical protein HDN1F_30340 [gamma proteobacterium HdN1]